MKHIPIIDTGHGYNTPGKRSKGFYNANGKVLLKENSVNEAVGNKLSLLLWQNKEKYHFLTNEWYDVSLSERVKREHKIARAETEKTLLLSIHADAFHIKNKAVGGRFYYYSKSGKRIAEQLTNYLRNNGYDLHLREPQKANFMMLRETSSPAVLFEMGFMTTKHDLDYLLSDEFRNKTATLLFDALNDL